MKTNPKTEWAHGAMLATMFGLAAANWTRVSDRLPIHWGLDGKADGYGGKFEGLLLLPLVSLATYALLRVLPRLDPGRANYAQFAKSYDVVRLAITAFNFVLYGTILWAITGHAIEVSSAMSLAAGVMFVVLGNAMGKFRPNWFVGIRTPWTLSSKVSWVKTHRVGGWAFIAVGLVQIVSALTLPPALDNTLMLTMLLGVSLALCIYSYLVWQGADDKGAPAGTSPAEG